MRQCQNVVAMHLWSLSALANRRAHQSYAHMGNNEVAFEHGLFRQQRTMSMAWLEAGMEAILSASKHRSFCHAERSEESPRLLRKQMKTNGRTPPDDNHKRGNSEAKWRPVLIKLLGTSRRHRCRRRHHHVYAASGWHLLSRSLFRCACLLTAHNFDNK